MRYVIALVFCLFMGMLGISLGVGTAFPPLNLVAKPIVCPDGDMHAKTSSRRGTGHNRNATYTKASWTCEETPGEPKPISTVTITLVAGTFYGVILFLPVALGLARAGKRRRAAAPRVAR